MHLSFLTTQNNSLNATQTAPAGGPLAHQQPNGDSTDPKVTYNNRILSFTCSSQNIMVYKGRKYHSGDTHLKRRWATKRRTKDLDQIDEDIKPQNAEKLINQEVDLDKPGFAQHYCVHCARYFITDQALKDHFTTKVHKRRLKALELEPYTVEDSERAAGLGSFKLPQKRQIETQPVHESVKRPKLEED